MTTPLFGGFGRRAMRPSFACVVLAAASSSACHGEPHAVPSPLAPPRVLASAPAPAPDEADAAPFTGVPDRFARPAGPYCVSRQMRDLGITSVRASGRKLTFDFGGHPPWATRVDLDTGVYAWDDAPPPPAPPADARIARAGLVLEADGGGFTVCKPAVQGATHCQRVIPFAYDRDETSESTRSYDLSPDGSRLVFLRANPQGRGGPVAEVFSVAENRLVASIALGAPAAPGEYEAPTVAWLGRRIYASLCTTRDDTCSASLLDPATGRATSLGIDPGAFHDGPTYAHVRDSVWGFASRYGDAVVLADVDAGTLQRRIHLPRPEAGDGGEAALAWDGATLVFVRADGGASGTGAVDAIDLSSGAVKHWRAPECADVTAEDPPPPPPRLRAGPRGAAVWPTRICKRTANAFVVENDCGCNDALSCRVVRAGKTSVDIRLRTDPSRPRACNDCFPMVPATCEVPPGLVSEDADADVSFRVLVNGAPAFEGLRVQPGGYVDWTGCAE